MNYKKIMFVFGASVLLLAACAGEEKGTEVEIEEEKSDATKSDEAEVESATEVDDALEELRTALEELKPKEVAANGDDSTILNPNIAEMTEGVVEVLYTNKEPSYAHDMDGFIITIDEYQVTKVSDVNRDSEYLFKDNVEGYVVTALATYENKRSNPVYYTGFASILMDDRFDEVNGDRFKLVPREDVLQSDDPASVNKYPAGFKKQGFLSFVMTNEQYDKLKETKPKLIIAGGASEREDMREAYMEEAVFDFIFNEDSKEKTVSGPDYYRDDLTNQNIADKKMIFEKKDIGQKLDIEGVEVTLEGVQYTEIRPTAEYADTFRNFADDGIVAVTVKLNVDNKSDEIVRLGGIQSILSVDDGEFRYLNQGSLEPDMLKTIEPGKSSEKLHVFLIDKYEFDRHENFELIFGPFSGDDGKKIFKGRDLLFKLPR
ncbi:DUF5068 domain-containing protein [Sporosarcina sp. ANT_H38]|uniref:DUF5068 domain-containing protein n=1 Tax=Sporosarcina sp. ANT_H38 TaxID=2597358 RepID=UPI0011F2D613|nr:DUF5068 domain-containing protein [Sporosarcina sp. ANT_H38]KAA0948510.1 DUF5068 domain-containing protein [Sporosarcina sp. ANT_H38]